MARIVYTMFYSKAVNDLMESIIHSHLLLLPMGRDRKIRTMLRTSQIAGFVTMPSEKKTNVLTVCALLIFIVSQCPSPTDMTK